MSNDILIDLRIDLAETINHLVKHKEEQLNHEISQENKRFLVETISEFVLRAVHKYINGSKEHGDDFLHNVDHLRECQNEVTDLIFYIGGALRKQHNFDNRFQ